MNSRIRTLLAGAACAAACTAALAVVPASTTAPANSVAVADNPMMGPPPSPEYVWMSGHWNSDAGQWKWTAGHWELPPSRSAVWVSGHWVPANGSWAWTNGAWNVAEAPQSPAMPPEPPGQPATGLEPGQGVPMPSTAAPGVPGQYGYNAGGQVPALYQQPVVTDYGPIDYSVGYPGYYWAGNSWAVYPGPFYLGLGWGRGFYGWGRGGYRGVRGFSSGHGGHFR